MRPATGIWEISRDGTILGYILVVADDVLVTARTACIEAVMRAFQNNRACSIIVGTDKRLRIIRQSDPADGIIANHN